MKRLRVPATSANLGPGFDSLGLAVNLYLNLEIVGESEEWIIHHDLGEDLPKDKNNLVIQTINQLAPELSPLEMRMTSDIPMTRGLGSSSTAIVAGIEVANHWANKGWTLEEKINQANRLEGHPDNVAPCLAGGLVIGVALQEDEVLWTKTSFPDAHFLALVPNYHLSTRQARSVLPKEFFFKEAVQASGLANVLVAKLMRGDLEAAGRLLERDRWHEPFRQKLVPELEAARKLLADQDGVYGTYLSGAGPTVMTLVHAQKSQQVAHLLRKNFPEAVVYDLTLDEQGSCWIED